MSDQDPGPITRCADDTRDYAATFTTTQQLDAIKCLLGHANAAALTGEEFMPYVAAAHNIARAHEHSRGEDGTGCGELLAYAMNRLRRASEEWERET